MWLTPLQGKILEAIRTNSGIQEITVVECLQEDEQMWYKGKIFLPESDCLRLPIIQEHHDTALAGNVGRAKTFDLLDRLYYWKEMPKDVD